MSCTDAIDLTDYAHDMSEVSNRAAGIIAAQKSEIERLKREQHLFVAAAVISSGGTLKVSKLAIADAPLAKIEAYEDPVNDVHVFKVVKEN